MAAVNSLYVAAASTAASAAALQWWAGSLLDGDADAAGGGGGGGGGDWLGTVLGSHVTVALLANLAAHVFLVLILSLKTLFFVQLTSSETRKLLEHIINYVLYKMFQSLARERLEQLNASPSATPSKYFRVYSALLLVLSADVLWIKLCVGFCKSCNSQLFWLMFFEPLSIGFETLQSIMVHGFQLFDIWQRHQMDSGVDYLDFQKTYKQAAVQVEQSMSHFLYMRLLNYLNFTTRVQSCFVTAGSFSEWRGRLVRNFGFVIDLISLLMSLGHYSMIFWLRGMAFHLVDAVLLLNLRALIASFWKRIKTYAKLRKALSSLDGALPDATYDEICAYDDECAICRVGPRINGWLLMSNLSKTSLSVISRSHKIYSREQLNAGLNQQRVPGHEHPIPIEHQNPADAVWRDNMEEKAANVEISSAKTKWELRGAKTAGASEEAALQFVPMKKQPTASVAYSEGAGLDSSWAPPWSSPGMDNPSSSSAVTSVGLSGVQMMMRQLTSVTDNYGHPDATWSLWPEPVAGSSVVPSSSSRPDGASAAGLRFRGTARPANGSMSEVLSMVDRVREVLPHIPDELIIEDLMRTNNINATVNNLLLMQ
uniref:CUE domain-containing protein n=3 Tax=Oryza TaxID=4527 RepID=A0A0E0I0U9_ORYNI